MIRLPFAVRQALYDAGTSLLAVPATMTATLALTAWLLVQVELRSGFSSAWLAVEPGTAQATLATLAGAMMTVISVVYSVLLVALSLASIQFSTRILAGMIRDRVSQAVLGLFLGTFAWQLVALRSIHLDPPFVPQLTVAAALGLAVVSLGALVLFIDRVIHGIQANHLVDRIARETEAVIDDVFPPGDPATPPTDAAWPAPPPDAAIVRTPVSGYVQLVDEVAVRSVAAQGLTVQLLRPMGAFAPAGVGLWAVHPAAACTPAVAAALCRGVDLGAIRTMQRDAEWGFRQLVDIGLKAISPAVNDPSTGGTCLDQLGRLLIRAGNRGTPPSVFSTGGGTVVIPGPRYSDLVDLAFEQLRQYGRSDMAIALRTVRTIADVAENVRHPEGRARLAVHAREVERAASVNFAEADREELGHRMARVERALGAAARWRPDGAPAG